MQGPSVLALRPAGGLAVDSKGGNFMADRFQTRARFWGIAPNHAFVGEAETNGVSERPFRTARKRTVHRRVRPSTETPSAPSPTATTLGG